MYAGLREYDTKAYADDRNSHGYEQVKINELIKKIASVERMSWEISTMRKTC